MYSYKGTKNSVHLIGFVVLDPEFNTTKGGQTVANLRIITNRGYRNLEGEMVESVEFHNIVTWSRLAVIVRDRIRKGMQISVEGQLRTRSYIDKKTLEKRYTTEIVACDIMIFGSKPSNELPQVPNYNVEFVDDTLF